MKLIGLESQMLYTMIQATKFLGSGEGDFKGFLPYMAWAAILVNRHQKHFNKLLFPQPKEAKYEIQF